jgi:hypothetical protein
MVVLATFLYLLEDNFFGTFSIGVTLFIGPRCQMFCAILNCYCNSLRDIFRCLSWTPATSMPTGCKTRGSIDGATANDVGREQLSLKVILPSG